MDDGGGHSPGRSMESTYDSTIGYVVLCCDYRGVAPKPADTEVHRSLKRGAIRQATFCLKCVSAGRFGSSSCKELMMAGAGTKAITHRGCDTSGHSQGMNASCSWPPLQPALARPSRLRCDHVS